MNLLRKQFAEVKFSGMDGSGPGEFSGYASVAGVLDSGGDIVEHGAFLADLPEFLANGFIGLGHNWDGLAIGTVAEAREDEHGLFLKGEYHSTPEAQQARRVAMERLARGKSVGLSIGFKINPNGAEMDEDGHRHLKSIKLYEVSQVNVPMLRPANMTEVKALPAGATPVDSEDGDPPEGSYEDLIADVCRAACAQLGDASVLATFPDYAIVAVWPSPMSSMGYGGMMPMSPDYYRVAYTLDVDGEPVLGDTREVQRMYVSGPEPDEAAAGKAIDLSVLIRKQRQSDTNKGFGLPFADHSEHVRVAVQEWMQRALSGSDVRLKEGRAISTARMASMAKMRDALHGHANEIDAMLIEVTPKPKAETLPEDYSALYTGFLLTQARLNGLLIPS